jgi:hypothetical protein
MNRFPWQDGLITMVGLWLFISPVILGYGAQDAVALDAVAWNFILCGLAVVTISFFDTVLVPDMLSARLNAVVMGMIIAATALWMISDGHRPFHTS